MFDENGTAPRIIIRVDGYGKGPHLYRGKLIYEHGFPFAVADEDVLNSLPEHAKIRLDASLLEEQRDDDEGYPLFLYRATVTLLR